MVRRSIGYLLVFGAVFAVCLTMAVSPSAADQPDTDATPVFQTTAPTSGFDRISVTVFIDADRTAHWRVEYIYQLESNASAQAFERVRGNLTSPPGPFVSAIRETLVERGEARTGREMQLQNGSVETSRSLPGERVGTVTYQFEWTNFAVQPGQTRIVVGDALPRYRVGQNESFSITWADRLQLQSATPEPADRREKKLTWNGPATFRVSGPTVELDLTGTGSSNELNPAPVAAAVVGLVVVGMFARSRLGSTSEPSDRVSEPDTAGEDTAKADDTSEDDSTESLLTDEERVLQVVDANGGRVRQQEILASVDWSRTKTSDVINEMNESKLVEVYRLGRENVVTRPGEIEFDSGK